MNKRLLVILLLISFSCEQAYAFPIVPPGVFQWVGTNYEGPGNVNGILSQAGQVKDVGILSGAQGEEAATTASIGDVNCDGQYCGDISAASVAQLNTKNEIAVNAPLRGFADNMQAKRYQDLLSVVPSSSPGGVGGQALSPLAVAFSSWNNASAGVAASLDRAFNFSNQLNIQRYLSEQNVDLAFSSSGPAGQQLRTAYRACIARNVKNGKSYGAAQEACISDSVDIQNVTVLALGGDSEKINATDKLSFKFLNSHPESETSDGLGQGAVKVADLVSRVAPNFFAPDDSDPRSIRLTTMIFVPTLVGLASQPSAASSTAAKQVMDVYLDWKRIFGDLLFQYEGNDVKVSRITPKFTYKDAVSNFFNNIKQVEADRYTSKPYGPFKQYELFKADYNYYLIWKLLAKYCRVLNGVEPESDISKFWVPSSAPADRKSITKVELQFLSTSSNLFDKTLASNLFDFARSGIDKPGSPYECQVIDPELEYAPPSEGSSLGVGETSLKRFYAMKDSDLTVIARVRRVVASLAWIIAQDQINTTVIAGYSLLSGLTSTDFESQAKRAGEAVIGTIARQYGSIDNYASYARSYNIIRAGLERELQPSVNSAPGAGGK